LVPVLFHPAATAIDPRTASEITDVPPMTVIREAGTLEAVIASWVALGRMVARVSKIAVRPH
jgi:hypothetical protein